MEENKSRKYNGVFSRKLRAGKRRTYFFDVRSTKYDDYYITITESKRRFDQGGYDSHKVFLYKEDFNKFMAALEETVNHIKVELMPDYNYEEFDRPPEDVTATDHDESQSEVEKSETKISAAPAAGEPAESSESEEEDGEDEVTKENPISNEEPMTWD